jgi:hypothetical protein
MAGLLTPQRQTAGNGLLDQAPRRVDDRVAGLLGLDPSIQRGAILPFGRDASGEMVMAWPEMALDTLKSLMLPGHVMQGGEFTPRDVTEMALDAGMLSSVAPAPAGAKRMFGGISAKNAPLDDLAKAEAMEKAGEAADDIWRATGWGRGADQKWRFEIDDSKSVYDGVAGPQMSVADAENVANSYRVGYNPKPLNQSSFDVDYPRGARSDDTGRLVESQEGVKLDAPFVAGRRSLGGDDQGLGSAELEDAAGRLVDRVVPVRTA